MEIIFLDIDGVLNSAQGWASGVCSRWVFCPEAVGNLNGILEAVPEAVIILSSSWRHMKRDELNDIFTNNGIDFSRVVGATPRAASFNGVRGLEIQAWLDAHRAREDDRFVILDDDTDMAHLMDRLVLVDSKVGLTRENAERAVELLSAAHDAPAVR